MNIIHIKMHPEFIVLCLCVVYLFLVAESTPVCEESYSYTEVPEDTPVGSVVKEIRCSPGSPRAGNVTYRIRDGNTHSKFGLNTTNGVGVVFVDQSISFESRTTSFQLSIEVSETFSTWTPVTFMLDIQITGVNDYPPLFLFSPYTVYVNEHRRPGSVIYTPIPYDFDKGGDGITTSIILEGDDSMFYMEPTTAKVYLRGNLDYERNREYLLKIQVTDNGLPQRRSSSTTLKIHIKDNNDNPPVCEEPYTTETFLETKLEGSLIKYMKCSDADSGNNGRLSYTIQQGDYTKFRLQGPRLVLSQQIDVDKEPNVWDLTILVRDRGNPSLSTRIDVVLYVEGVDDNIPQWAAPENGKYVIEMEENSAIGSHVVRVSANDPDKGDESRSVAYYKDEYSSIFTVKAATGDIFISGELDRERQDSYRLPVSAVSNSNPGERIRTEVIINVKDVNDNTPEFEKDVFQIFISEDTAPNTELTSVTAQDGDAGDNGQIHYRIIGGNSDYLFKVSRSTGVVSLSRPLDYESVATHTLYIQGSDNGHPSLSSTCTLVVSLLPINEFEPIFLDIGVVNIPEDTTIGSSVFKVQASDGDKGLDGVLVYSVHPQETGFAVESRTGVVRLLEDLDRETTPEFKVLVFANDMSETKRKSGSVVVTITVDDRNDIPPVCQFVYSTVLSGPVESGDVVQQLNCSDKDEGRNRKLTYTIVSGNINDDFSVTHDGNVVIVRRPSSTDYRIGVSVSDAGTPPLSTEVVVIIKAGGKPTFRNLPQTVSLPESVAVGTSIFKVIAASVSSQIKYKIDKVFTTTEPDEDLLMFMIDEFTGDIFTWEEMDRETIDELKIQIKVKDTIADTESIDILDITITDVNDHAPKFEKSLYNVSVIENIQPMTKMLQLIVIDEDAEENGEVDISITEGNEGNMFSVDETGAVIITSLIDREETGRYSLVVTGIDRGYNTQLTGSATILVTVIDSDEYSPEFVHVGTDLETSLREDTPLGTTVFIMEARDLDIESDLVYRLDELSKDHFVIDSHTGQIYLSKILDRETNDKHEVVVTASVHRKVVSATVQVIVTDVNDNEPHFSKNVYLFEVSETAHFGDIAGTLTVSDNDLEENGEVNLYITSGNDDNSFTIKDQLLLVNGILDYGEIGQYVIHVEARDNGYPPRASFASVIVKIKPQFHAPEFKQDFVSIHVPENIHVGFLMFDADATAAGAREGKNGELIYDIVEGNHDLLFSIDGKSGEMRVLKRFDKNKQPETIIVKLMAQNRHAASMVAAMTLKVFIDDVNDFAPDFDQSHYVFRIREDMNIGSVISRVNAKDEDRGDNALISYELDVSEEAEPFKIDSHNGDLKLKQQLDFVFVNSYQFYVRAYDHGSPALTGTTLVSVEVIDINNNAPQFQFTEMTVNIKENTAVGRNIYHVRASDADFGMNGEISYSIKAGNTDKVFQIDSESGMLQKSGDLDRELIDAYTLIIELKDNGAPMLTNTGAVKILIKDTNDNNPVFSQESYMVTLDRFSPIETHVVTVLATDADEGANSEVEYELSHDFEQLFHINPKSGKIETYSELKLINDSVIKLVVIARDSGITRLSSSVTVEIELFPPKETPEDDFLFTLSEYGTPNTFVGKIGVKSGRKYDIVSGNFKNNFRISPTDGRIFLNGILDREEYSEYFLRVRYTHRIFTKIMKQTNVRIVVTDENDNTPVFDSKFYSFDVLEHTPVGFSVFTITAADRDLGKNGKVTYTILNGAQGQAKQFLHVNENGTFSIAHHVSYLSLTHLNFTLVAHDNGLLSRQATAQVYMKVIAIPECGASCDSKSSTIISLEIPVTASKGDVLFTLTPQMFGLDISPDVIKYIQSERNSIFAVDKASGVVKLDTEAAINAKDTWMFWIVADTAPARYLSLVRVDAFVPESHAVVITHSVSYDVLKMSKSNLQEKLQTFFPDSRLRVWKMEGQVITGRRRLLVTGSRSYIYVIRDDQTESLDGIERQKRYLSQSEILEVLGSPEGVVSDKLTAEDFDNYPVVSVLGYKGPEPIVLPWLQTVEGKVVVGVAVTIVILVVIVIVLLGVVKIYKKKQAERRSSMVNENGGLNFNQGHQLRDHRTKVNNVSPTSRPEDPLPLVAALKMLSQMTEEDRNELIEKTFNTRKSEERRLHKTMLHVNKLQTSTRIQPSSDSEEQVTSKVSNDVTSATLHLFQVSAEQKQEACLVETLDASTPSVDDIDELPITKPLRKHTKSATSQDDGSVSSLEMADADEIKEPPKSSPSQLVMDSNSADTADEKDKSNMDKSIIIGGVEYDGVGKDTETNEKYLYSTRTGDKIHVTDDILKHAIEHRKSVVSPGFDRSNRGARLSTYKRPMIRKTSRTRFSTTTIWEMDKSSNEQSDEKQFENVDNKTDIENELSKRRKCGIDNSKTANSPTGLSNHTTEPADTIKCENSHSVDTMEELVMKDRISNTVHDTFGDINAQNESQSTPAIDSDQNDEDQELKRKISANDSWDKLLKQTGAVTSKRSKTEVNEERIEDGHLSVILENTAQTGSDRWARAKNIVKFVRPVYKPLNLENVTCKVPKGKSDPKDCLSKDPVYASWAKVVGRRVKTKMIKKKGEPAKKVTVREGRSLPASLMGYKPPEDVVSYTKTVASQLPPHLAKKRMSVDFLS